MLLALALFTTIRSYTAFHNGNIAGLFPGLLPMVLATPVIAGMVRYRRSLKFAVLPTRVNKAGNRLILERFLREQQLQVVNHPLSKDIFQIVSTPVSTKTGDMRQVMVFIADEGRILLNSHFTASGLMIAPASRLHHKMKQQLEASIAGSGMQSSTTSLPG